VIIFAANRPSGKAAIVKTLLVEDDPATRELLAEILSARGCEVTACEDGKSALTEIKKNSFLLVLLDLILPYVNGLELCREIRKTDEGKYSTILVCTGLVTLESLRAVLDAGADDYLIKPLDFDVLNIRLSIAETMVKNRGVRKQFEHKLYALASQSAVAEEQQRRRFASDLHDGVGQNLAWCKYRLCELRDKITQPDCAPYINEVAKALDTVIAETRSLTFEISPPMLYEMGLEAALEWLTEHFQERYKLKCAFDYAGSPSGLPTDVAVTLFQSTRELLFNVVKHAGAKKAAVTVSKANGRLSIIVSDDGKGFNLLATTHRIEKMSGFGIFSIRQRLHFIGGDLNIRSDKKQGTQITMTAPLSDTAGKLKGTK